MKTLALTILIVGAFSSAVGNACDEQSLALAKSLYNDVVIKVQLGTAISSDSQIAGKHLLDTKLCASLIEREAYCLEVTPIQVSLNKKTLERYSTGQATLSAYVDGLKELNRLKEFCK